MTSQPGDLAQLQVDLEGIELRLAEMRAEDLLREHEAALRENFRHLREALGGMSKDAGEVKGEIDKWRERVDEAFEGVHGRLADFVGEMSKAADLVGKGVGKFGEAAKEAKEVFDKLDQAYEDFHTFMDGVGADATADKTLEAFDLYVRTIAGWLGPLIGRIPGMGAFFQIWLLGIERAIVFAESEGRRYRDLNEQYRALGREQNLYHVTGRTQEERDRDRREERDRLEREADELWDQITSHPDYVDPEDAARAEEYERREAARRAEQERREAGHDAVRRAIDQCFSTELKGVQDEIRDLLERMRAPHLDLTVIDQELDNLAGEVATMSRSSQPARDSAELEAQRRQVEEMRQRIDNASNLRAQRADLEAELRELLQRYDELIEEHGSALFRAAACARTLLTAHPEFAGPFRAARIALGDWYPALDQNGLFDVYQPQWVPTLRNRLAQASGRPTPTGQRSALRSVPGGPRALAGGMALLILIGAFTFAMLTGGGEVEAETAMLSPSLPPPQVQRISAALAVPVTTYTVDASDPGGGDLSYEWSMTTTVDHERCGTPEVPWTRSGQTVRWSHGDQSPDNCSHVGTNHDVTVTVTVSSSSSGRSVRCTVMGSDPFTDENPACVEVDGEAGSAAAGASPGSTPGDDDAGVPDDPPDGAPPPDGRAPSHAATVDAGSVWVADACILRADPSVYGMPAYQVRGTLEGTFDFTGDPLVSRDGLLAVVMLVEGAGFPPTEAAYRLDWGEREHAAEGSASIGFFVRVPIAVEAILDVPRWDVRQSYSGEGERLNIGASLGHALGVPGPVGALRAC